LQQAIKTPYARDFDEFFARRPERAGRKAGCSMLVVQFISRENNRPGNFHILFLTFIDQEAPMTTENTHSMPAD
jgi:hypothetical protein